MKEIEQTITTLEICEMMNMKHNNILRKLEGREINGKHVKGIIEILNERQMVPVSCDQSTSDKCRSLI